MGEGGAGLRGMGRGGEEPRTKILNRISCFRHYLLLVVNYKYVYLGAFSLTIFVGKFFV